MEDAVRLYQQHHQTVGHAARTIEWHQERLDRFYAFLQSRKYPTDVTAIRAPHLREWR